MARQRQIAFTLVELLVVVSIIALLVTMLMPSLQRGIELSRRAACKVNCREIAKGVKLYALEARFHRGGPKRAFPTVNPTPSGWASGNNANRECLYRLVTTKFLSPGSLVCPSVNKARYDHFASGEASAYAFISMVGRPRTLNTCNAGMVIVGDRNPRFEPDSKNVISGESHQNSMAHLYPGRSREGQNIGRIDESAAWIEQPKVNTGTYKDDYIYESSNPGSDGQGTTTFNADVFLLN